MRIFLFTSLCLASSLGYTADPPNKRGGGLFGFGSRTGEQLSSALFPQEDSAAPAPTKTKKKSQAAEIFRPDQPTKVDPVSYTIENGRRVEKQLPDAKKKSGLESPLAKLRPAPSSSTAIPGELEVTAPSLVTDATEKGSKKLAGWLGFGKRNDSVVPENPLVTPIPVPTPTTSPATPPVAANTIKPEVATPLAGTLNQDAPQVAEPKEKSSWIPFLHRKKGASLDPEIAPLPPSPPLVAETVSNPPSKPAETAKPAPKPAPKPTEKASEKPGEVATFEIRRDDSQPTVPKKEPKAEREGGILTPITKVRPPRKEIDLSAAETIIQDGEIVAESASSSTVPAPTNSSAGRTPRQAPNVVNGVKTYSSWDDVGARSSSVADRIIQQIR